MHERKGGRRWGSSAGRICTTRACELTGNSSVSVGTFLSLSCRMRTVLVLPPHASEVWHQSSLPASSVTTQSLGVPFTELTPPYFPVPLPEAKSQDGAHSTHASGHVFISSLPFSLTLSLLPCLPPFLLSTFPSPTSPPSSLFPSFNKLLPESLTCGQAPSPSGGKMIWIMRADPM